MWALWQDEKKTTDQAERACNPEISMSLSQNELLTCHHFNIHSFLPSFLFLLPSVPEISSFLVFFFASLLPYFPSPLFCLLSIFIPFSPQFPILISFLLSLSFFAPFGKMTCYVGRIALHVRNMAPPLSNQLAGQEELPCSTNIDRPLAKQLANTTTSHSWKKHHTVYYKTIYRSDRFAMPRNMPVLPYPSLTSSFSHSLLPPAPPPSLLPLLFYLLLFLHFLLSFSYFFSFLSLRLFRDLYLSLFLSLAHLLDSNSPECQFSRRCTSQSHFVSHGVAPYGAESVSKC